MFNVTNICPVSANDCTFEKATQNASGHEKWERLSAQYIEAKRIEDEYKKIAASLKSKLIKIAENSHCDKMSGNGVQVYKVTRKGSVDYSIIPELANVNIERYRKQSSESWTIKIG